MEVFISWSGPRSKKVADALSMWLANVLQRVEPWTSEAISPGTRWSQAIAARLEASNFGIVCVTPENVDSPWLHFEAGAVAKSVTDGHVVPLFIGVRASDFDNPLKQFQGVDANRDGILKLVRSLNTALGSEARPDANLNELFDTWWTKIEPKFMDAVESDPPAGKAKAPRDMSEVLDEVLQMLRSVRSAQIAAEGMKPTDYRIDDRDLLSRNQHLRERANWQRMRDKILGAHISCATDTVKEWLDGEAFFGHPRLDVIEYLLNTHTPKGVLISEFSKELKESTEGGPS